MNASIRSLLVPAMAIVGMALATPACKPPNKQTPLQSASPSPTPNAFAQGGALSDGCNPPSCPKAQVTLQSGGVVASSISAQSGSSITLNPTAKSSQFPGRVFAVFSIEPSPVVSSMTIRGNRSSSASMTWSPYSTDPTSGSVRVKTRDMTACQKQNVAAPQQCADFNRSLDLFDSESTIPWTLAVTNTPPPVSNGNGGGNQIGSVIGVLGSILGGGGGGNILGSLGGILGGGLGGGAATGGGAAAGTTAGRP